MYERFYGFRERPFSLTPDPELPLPEPRPPGGAQPSPLRHRGPRRLHRSSPAKSAAARRRCCRRCCAALDRQTSISRLMNTMLDARELIEAIMLDFGLDPRPGPQQALSASRPRAVSRRPAEGRAPAAARHRRSAEPERLGPRRSADALESRDREVEASPDRARRTAEPARPARAARARTAAAAGHGQLSPRAADGGRDARVHQPSAAPRVGRRAADVSRARSPTSSTTHSRGVARMINVIADAVLLYGYGSDKRLIDLELTNEVVSDLGLAAAAPEPARPARWPSVHVPDVALMGSPLAIEAAGTDVGMPMQIRPDPGVPDHMPPDDILLGNVHADRRFSASPRRRVSPRSTRVIACCPKRHLRQNGWWARFRRAASGHPRPAVGADTQRPTRAEQADSTCHRALIVYWIRFVRGASRVGVVGLGYVGLPLAVEFARAGFDTTGIDLDARKVDAVNAAASYIPDVPTADVAALVAGGPAAARPPTSRAVAGARHHQHLRADAAAQDEGPRHVVHRVGRRRRSPRTCIPGMLIILESTTYPGTTEEFVQPLLEASGLKAGRRLLPGVLARARRSGQREVQHAQRAEGRRRHRRRHRTALASALYGAAIETRRPGQLAARRRDGEAAREHVPRREHRPRQRDRADVRPAGHRRVGSRRRGGDQAVRLHAVLSGPRPRRPLHPDRSVLSVVEGEAERLRLALHRAGRPGQRRDAASSSSTRSPTRSTSARKPINGSTVLVLGIAYKRDIDDIRESPSLDVMTLLRQKGARVRYPDPYVPVLPRRRWHGGVELHSEPLTAAATRPGRLRRHPHRPPRRRLRRWSSARRTVIVDTRNAIKGRHPHVFRLGAPAPSDTAAIPPGRDVADDASLSDDAAPDAQAVA